MNLLMVGVELVAAVAGPPAAAITGKVLRSDGRPAASALVLFRDRTRPMAHLVATNGDGGFRVGTLAPGRYRVEAATLDGSSSAADSITLVVNQSLALRPLTLGVAASPVRQAPSAAWLTLLPAGESTRRFVLDCTGCHQFDETRVASGGARRSAAKWAEDIGRMLQYAGPRSSFPVISDWPEPNTTGRWLATELGQRRPAVAAALPAMATDFTVTEYDMPMAADLPHDVAIQSDGSVVITGMMSHTMLVLDPATGGIRPVAIPVPNANPRAVELDRDGNWWVLLGGPKKVGRYDPKARRWIMTDIAVYPHSIALGQDGRVWFNGHFTQDPELIGVIDPGAGATTTFDLPLHPVMGKGPAGPIPYEQRIGPDGAVWISELQGNRMIRFDPKTRNSTTFTLPTPWSGPRRFDIDSRGIVWIPAYSANLLVRLDPGTGAWKEYPIPVPGATPYIARVDSSTGTIWIGTSAADAVFGFDPSRETFRSYPLPSQGALVRHLAIDPRNRDVWLAYGASPGRIPAKVARLRVGAGPS